MAKTERWDVKVYGPGNIDDPVLHRVYRPEEYGKIGALATAREDAAAELGGDPDDYQAYATPIQETT